MPSKFGGVPVEEKLTKGSKFGGVAVDETIQTAPEKPSLGEEVYAGAYGLGKGVLGGLGEVEKFGAYDVPAFFGARKKGTTDKLMERETLFPTVSEVEQVAQKIGIPRPAKGTEASELLGEIAPAVAGGAQLAKTLGTYGITKASDLAKKLTGKEAVKESEAAAKRLETSLPEYTRAGERAATQRAATETEAEYAKRARQQENLRQAEQNALTQAKEQQETAARKFADLGKPTEKQALGTEMQRRLTGTQFTREARSSQQAARDYEKYFNEAKGFENSEARQVMLQKLEAMSQSPSVGSAGRKFASQALKDLQESENAYGAEKEFRKYFEQASAPQQAGYGAIEQQANRDVSDIISEALNTHAPYREVTRKTYKEFKTPLDAYETLFGKKGVAKERAVPDRVQMMPTEYPSTYFKNKDTINALREQLAGDETTVRKFANQHAVNELQGKTAAQAADWLKTNSEWVNSVEGLNTRVNRYVDSLKRAETEAAKREEQAAKLGKKAKEVGAKREAGQAEIAGTEAVQKQKLTEFREQLNLYPEKSPAIADNMIKYLSEEKLLSPEKLKLLKADVDVAKKLPDAIKRQKALRNAFIYYGVITAGGGYGTYKLGQYIF
jgi:hypothetical protein